MDSRAQLILLQRGHDAILSGGKPPAAPRSVISVSWARSTAAHVNPEVPLMRETLPSGADEA